MESIMLLNESMLVLCTYKDEKEKKERLKVCAAKIKWAAKAKEDNNKRKINEIAETLDKKEEILEEEMAEE